MITILCHRDGQISEVERIDPGWLDPSSGVVVWVDLVTPAEDEQRVLRDVFKFHALAIEDALSELHYPKLESYDGYLYLILHAISCRQPDIEFLTHDVDFFLGPSYLVTVHDGASPAMASLRETARRNSRIMAEGAPALLHRIVDSLIEHYRPEVDRFDDRVEALEKLVFEKPTPDVVRSILDLKRQVGSLRRVAIPERDVIGRLARQEFGIINREISYRFRDVYDQLVRLTDETLIFQDRVTGLLEAHVSNASNRLNEVMKVLTLIATIFMPLTVLTGAYGMNVGLPHLPGGETAQFWWIVGLMAVLAVWMLVWFRKRGWL